MIPIHVITAPPDGEPREPPPLPDDKLCYLVGSNGAFKQVKNEFYTAIVPVEGPSHLAEIKEQATITVPKLPLKLLRQAEAFFIAAYQEHKSEAVVLLLANAETGEWRIEVPPQSVAGLRVKYDIANLPAPPTGFARFGSIHSHANIGAFHSGTDDSDEIGDDGLHITIGNVDKPLRTYSARYMLAGQEFKADLENVIEAEPAAEFNPAWLKLVTRLVQFEIPRPEPQVDHGFGRELPDDYEYLWAMREEIDERLLEAADVPRP